MRFLIQRFYCELLWGFRTLKSHVLRRAGSGHRVREQLEENRRILREILRDYPYWQLGHARLGMNELALARMNELPLPPRSRAAIRCACDAIRRLASLTEPHGRANAEAMLMEASLAFEDREFAAARSALLPLLESPVLCQLTEEDAFRALGLAARCAVVLDGEAAAKSFLERIPESRRAQI